MKNEGNCREEKRKSTGFLSQIARMWARFRQGWRARVVAWGADALISGIAPDFIRYAALQFLLVAPLLQSSWRLRLSARASIGMRRGHGGNS